jgi:hypothetical protein
MFALLEAQELTNSSTHKNMVKTTQKKKKGARCWTPLIKSMPLTWCCKINK